MTDDEQISHLARQLVELQTQLAFQEDSISQLSDQIAAQQRDIEKLQVENRALQQNYQELQQQPGVSAEPPPPHY